MNAPARLSLLLAAASLAAGCRDPQTDDPGAGAPGDVATIQLELTMLPNDAACVQVTVKVGTQIAVRTLDVGPRGRSVVTLDALPIGTATISGAAYPSACNDIETVSPTWTADPVMATLSTGTVATVTLAFQRGARVRVNADFPADVPFVQQAVIGLWHSCAGLRDGTLRCWGSQQSGALGDGITSGGSQLKPIVVSRDRYVQIASHFTFNCGVLRDGTMRCWGSNSHGNIGDGSSTDRPFPTPVSGLTDVVQAAVGVSHACGLHRDGTVSCWGRNSDGQLGLGFTGGIELAPVPVLDVSRVIQIEAANNATYALTADGLVYSWGHNANGQLGDGSMDMFRATPARIPGLTNVAQVAGGGDHACARLGDGSVKCWGENEHGQLGDGTTMDRRSPVLVNGLTNVTGIAGLTDSTVAARADGSARSWGDNAFGQLGDGTTTDRLTPVAVVGLTGTGVDQIVGGVRHACVIVVDGNLRCWGLNDRGQLGDNTTTNRSTPVAPLF